MSYVGQKFFKTLGIALARGRGFEAREVFPMAGQAGSPVAVISESLAAKYFRDGDAIGYHIELKFSGSKLPPLEIVGVAKDTNYQNLREKTFKLYTPYPLGFPRIGFQVRVIGNLPEVATQIRAVIRRLDPKAFILDLRSMREVAEHQFEQERAIARISGVFSALALLLASIGLYGVLAYNVVRCTRDIGVRMALGAQARDVVRLIVLQGLILTTIGCAAGLCGGLLLSRFVANRLYGVGATDPANLGVVVGLLVLVSLLASAFPAMRAAKVDPMVALRCE